MGKEERKNKGKEGKVEREVGDRFGNVAKVE